MRASSVGVITPVSPETRTSDSPTSAAIESPPTQSERGLSGVGVRNGATVTGTGTVVGAVVSPAAAVGAAEPFDGAVVGAPATDDAVGSVVVVRASNESSEPALRPRAVDGLAGLGQPRPPAQCVERLRDPDRDGALPSVGLALGHVEQGSRVQERRDEERDAADDQDLTRRHRPAPKTASP